MREGWTCGQRPWVHAVCFLWAGERNRKALTKTERQKIRSEIKCKQTHYAVQRMCLWIFSLRKSIFFPPTGLVPVFHSRCFFFSWSTLPPCPPEISFQHAKPCKNRPRVFTLTPVCKVILVCWAGRSSCCSGPCATVNVPPFSSECSGIAVFSIRHISTIRDYVPLNYNQLG